MSRRIAAIALLSAAAVAAACGADDDNRPRPQSPSGGAGAAGGAGAGGGDGGRGGAGGGACGDGVAALDEACDGADLRGATCESLGFDVGELRCSPDCTADTSGCTGVEACQDGRDNDGDGSADCGDPECEAACADLCAAPVALSDPASVTGDTSGHAAVEGGCAAGAPGVAYTFTATTTGFLDVVLTPKTDAALVAVLRGDCASAGTQLACGGASAGAGIDNRLTIPVREGDAFHVIVTSSSADQAGAFELGVRSRVPACGDRIQDPGEECDTGDDEPGDGCSDECRLEATEVEPNDTIASANPYEEPFFAIIDRPDDKDVVRVTVPTGPTALVVETGDITSSDCLNGRLDTIVEILDESGALIVQRDFGGVGHCARAVAPALPAGDYYVRVTARVGPEQRAPYGLLVTLVPEVCGDGDTTAGEQCDDGNTAPGDGCSAACRFELHETEPNDAPAQADAHAAPWLAEISPAGDVDVVAVNVPGPRSTLIATVSDNGTEACATNRLDSYVEILGGDGADVLASDDDSGVGYCSSASATDLAAGTYRVRVRASDLVPDATFFYRLNVTIL
ncbi:MULTISPECIES: DUF4215 domain-containing protein [Sorangium]|uniref:Peptidase C-terminal archaeal/bacterial domain-containing protein n=1 Tax=Sorangium cellulosum TaxID=56 RepID=A0A4P2QTV1_SORCE|nr:MULTISPECIES: DUF4215 domain-containing protein [Sorangium]AUX33481.1 hypothetical protein SOCE836_056410 [Sorangium cellulosum]WCQ92797.1 hypothetical protein NQZ70_05543 [Sorangium sp. Soce836]